MELNLAETDLFAAYLSRFTPLADDRRTASLLGETVCGIIASESLCCSKIAAFPPGLTASRHAEKRIRRMVHGETTTCSPFDADDVLARLRARGVEQVRGEAGIWVILDGSGCPLVSIRKPYARVMAGLPPVKRLSGRDGARLADDQCDWDRGGATRFALSPSVQQQRRRFRQ